MVNAMSSLFVVAILVIVSSWILDVAHSFPSPGRTAGDVQGERMKAALSELPTGEFHHGAIDAAHVLSSLSEKKIADIDGHLTGDHHLGSEQSHFRGREPNHNGRGSLLVTGGQDQKVRLGGVEGHMGHGSSISAEARGLDKKAEALELLRRLSMQSSTTGETAETSSGGLHFHAVDGAGSKDGKLEISPLEGKRTADRELIASIRGNTQSPQANWSSGSLRGLGHMASAHSGVTQGKDAGKENLNAGRLHHTSTISGGHKDSPTSAATGVLDVMTDGGQQMMGELLEMWAKIGGPEMLTKGVSGLGHIVNAHSGVIGGSAVGLEHLNGGRLYQPPAIPGDQKKSPTGVATGGLDIAFGGEKQISDLMEMWAKIGGPEMLGKIAAMGGNMYGGASGAAALPTSSAYPPPPRALSLEGTGTIRGNTQSFSAGGVSRGSPGNIHRVGNPAIGGRGIGSNTSQPTELLYTMTMPGPGEIFKGNQGTASVTVSAGRNEVAGPPPSAYGYPTFDIIGPGKGSATPGTVTYTAIPVGSVATRGQSVQRRPMFYGGTSRSAGTTYTAWPLRYGMAASIPYQMVAYNAIPARQVVTTRVQPGVMKPAGAVQAAYYTLQGGRTQQQRPAGGVTYAALPAIVLPAATYKAAAG